MSAGSEEKNQVTSATTPAMAPSHVQITLSMRMRCFRQRAISPTSVAMAVAISIGRKMSVGFDAPPCARYIMMLIGIRQSPELLSTRNMIMASVAVSFLSLSLCISCMARSPIGVAALSSPSMLAEMFMKIAPIAGSPFGMPGNSREKIGEMSRPKNSITPPRSPTFMIPIHSVSTPVSPSEISKAKAACEKEAFIISVHTPSSPVKMVVPRAIRNAMAKKAIQIQLRTMIQAGVGCSSEGVGAVCNQ